MQQRLELKASYIHYHLAMRSTLATTLKQCGLDDVTAISVQRMFVACLHALNFRSNRKNNFQETIAGERLTQALEL